MDESPNATLTRRCFECGEAIPEGSKRAFCKPNGDKKCQKNHNNRMVREGVALVPLLKAFVAGRGGGNGKSDPRAREAMRELTRYGRELLDRDKAKNRPSALDYYSHLTRDGTQYTDRRAMRRR